MRRTVPYLLGAIMIVVGVLWTGEGLGYIGGSPMTGVSFWAIVGPALAGLGVALIVSAVQHRRR